MEACKVMKKIGASQPFTPETIWAIEDITRERDSIRGGYKNTKIGEAIDEWTRREPGDIRKVTKLVRSSPEYSYKLHQILKKQYGDKIVVYRGGGLFYTGGKPMKGAISVTSDRDIAVKFGYGREPLRFIVDANKVLAASPTLESELIVYVSDLKAVPKVKAGNPLTQQERSEIKNWANTQFIISRKYADPVRSSFYLGRSVAAGKLASQYNPMNDIEKFNREIAKRNLPSLREASKLTKEQIQQATSEGNAEVVRNLQLHLAYIEKQIQLAVGKKLNPLKRKSPQSKNTGKVVCLFLFAAALTLPVFRSGLRTNLTFVEWILNHTIWGPKVEYVPEERYMEELS